MFGMRKQLSNAYSKDSNRRPFGLQLDIERKSEFYAAGAAMGKVLDTNWAQAMLASQTEEKE